MRENNRILQCIGARGIPRCVISLIKMGFGVNRNASKPRADELLNIVPIPFTSKATNTSLHNKTVDKIISFSASILKGNKSHGFRPMPL